ncbi:MAG: NAD(P)-binding domain-containing protein [Rickettsiales bacterium]|nr:NAD(P)-binding domain-containing protein [Rickettsiales bacterium]
MKRIAILGGGVLGSAISNLVSSNGGHVAIFSNDIESIEEINEKHTNSKYTNCPLNKDVIASNNLSDTVDMADYVFIILPSRVVSSVLIELSHMSVKFNKKFVIFSKGIDESSGKFFTETVCDLFPESDVATLSGPNFADEIIEQKITVTTLATENIIFFDELKSVLNCNYFAVEYFNDLKAVQLSGLVKNVLAIMCGLSEGLGLGRNTFAAMMLRGISEVKTLCLRYNYNGEVISTPAGIGDIILTCSSQKSRNMSFGFRIGTGERVSNILSSSNTVVEGLINAQNLENLSRKVAFNSIAKAVLDIAQNDYSKEELVNIVRNTIFGEKLLGDSYGI